MEDKFENDIKEMLHFEKTDTLDDFECGYHSSNFQAWDRCYSAFQRARDNGNYENKKLCFSLTDYLEAWGMYSRKALLTSNRAYTIHTDAVNLILAESYSDLQGLSIDKWDEKKESVEILYKEIKETYERAISKSSETLVTKVMLGALACVPAFDVNINSVLRETYPRKKFSTIEKVSALINLCKKESVFDCGIAKRLKAMGQPDMKILDFYLFFYGQHLQKLKK